MRWFATMLMALMCAGLGRSGRSCRGQKIQDNSFLLEEAYNQEDGVIQHIQSYLYNKKTRDWLYTFTQEWPVPKQAHQLSYTIPVAHLQEGDTTGLGDIAINYRYQLIMKGPLAVSPRFSLILPTGDEKRGMGRGATGYQVNLPVSVEIGEQWVSHWNAGATFTPDAKELADQKRTLGATIWAQASSGLPQRPSTS